MKQQQRKCDGPVWCVCEERLAAEHWVSAEAEVVHGSLLSFVFVASAYISYVPVNWYSHTWVL